MHDVRERLTQLLQTGATGYPTKNASRGELIDAIRAKTVNAYKHRIQTKIGLGNRVEYVRFALDARLLDE
jgi:DNA-binding NarL/FixJ family response regulator